MKRNDLTYFCAFVYICISAFLKTYVDQPPPKKIAPADLGAKQREEMFFATSSIFTTNAAHYLNYNI